MAAEAPTVNELKSAPQRYWDLNPLLNRENQDLQIYQEIEPAESKNSEFRLVSRLNPWKESDIYAADFRPTCFDDQTLDEGNRKLKHFVGPMGDTSKIISLVQWNSAESQGNMGDRALMAAAGTDTEGYEKFAQSHKSRATDMAIRLFKRSSQ